MMMMWQNRSVDGARCVTATAALDETSHVANCKAVSPAEDVYEAVNLPSEGPAARGRVEQLDQYKESKQTG